MSVILKDLPDTVTPVSLEPRMEYGLVLIQFNLAYKRAAKVSIFSNRKYSASRNTTFRSLKDPEN